MLYLSTRGSGEKLVSAAVIAKGLSEDGGLFVPEFFPGLSPDEIEKLANVEYSQRATRILGLFLDDFSAAELDLYSSQAYSAPGFDHPDIAPLHKLGDGTYSLELWHGPTSAFKDMALQILPRLLTASLKKTGEKSQVCILVATSGDTGKAALEGFCDVPGTKIMVFYPRDGVSDVQKLQMTSQKGSNVNVVSVEGNFDDAQAGVKAIFSDASLREELGSGGYFLSSANSINWGRLVPQIAYYFSAYCDLLSKGEIKLGQEVNYCVPTGNFGNILAGYYAVKMGLPVGKLICASNRNDVLTDFISDGIYDKNRRFYTTVSPSMDILVSSNLERLLYELSGKVSGTVSGYMAALAEKGRYEIPSVMKNELNRVFAAGRCSEEDTLDTIAQIFKKQSYLIDTHTAVAFKVLGDYRRISGDNRPAVVLSTASPYKFCDSVLKALGQEASADGTVLIADLEKFSGCPVPGPLADLAGKTPRFPDSVPVQGMQKALVNFLL